MKQLLLLTVCISLLNHEARTAACTQQPIVQQEVVDIVEAITQHLAELIIHHKKESNPEVTKQHSVALVRSITELGVLCINYLKAKKASAANSSTITRSGSKDNIYDPTIIDSDIEEIASILVKIIQEAEGNV